MIRHRAAPIAASIAVLLLAGTPTAAFAHPGSAVGFMSGLLHPVFGLDHFLAMLSVGIVSAQLGGRHVWTIPTVFVLAMIGGAIPGIEGSQWPFSEIGIALSVVVLGISITMARTAGTAWPIMLAAAVFGSLHGHAHGLELPNSADPVYYAAGFLTSTATIHLIGVGIGHVLTVRARYVRVLRYLGASMAGIGVVILLDLMASR